MTVVLTVTVTVPNDTPEAAATFDAVIQKVQDLVAYVAPVGIINAVSNTQQ